MIDCVDAAARERADGGGPPQTYALGSRALFADQRVSVNVPPTFEERAGRALGPGGATFVGVVFEGCDLGGDGAVEALADAECASPTCTRLSSTSSRILDSSSAT